MYHGYSFKSTATLGGKNGPTCVVHAVAVHIETLWMAAGLNLNGYSEKAPAWKIHCKCCSTGLEGSGRQTLSC